MSTLSSSSTTAEIQAAYDDNGSYEEDGSVTKCAAFITAVRLLIRRLVTEAAHGAERVRLDENLRQYRQELKHAQAWLAAQGGTDGAPRVRHRSLEEFRD